MGLIFLTVIQSSPAWGAGFGSNQEAIEWTSANGGNGHWYALIEGPCSSWSENYQSEMISFANGVGAQMVSFNTLAEWEFIKTSFSDVFDESCADDYYIGLVSDPGDFSWRWISGEPFDFEAWGTSACGAGPYPNDAPNSTHAYVVNRQDCGQVWDDGVNGANHSGDFMIEWSADCNNDGIVDFGQIRSGTLADIDSNGVPDCCEGGLCAPDCDGDGTSDEDEIASGEAGDINQNGLPDNCEPDCDSDGVPDFVELESGSFDCNYNTVPDECEIADGSAADGNSNGVIDACELDCNENTVFDFLELDLGLAEDCDQNRVPDECDIADGSQSDCNLDGIPDSCLSFDDCDGNGVPDECQTDTDQDGSIDACDADDDNDGIPDECDVDSFMAPVGAQYWDPAEGGNGHWYMGMAAPGISWEDAAAQAEALGGYLCTVPSAEENLWVFTFVASDPSLWNTWFGPWIGGYQDTSSPEYSEPDGAWSWVTGESWSYTNWGPGDPSNTNGQDHAAFGGIPGNEIRFTWNDLAAPEPGGFIVEWSGASDCNGNGILDSCEVDTDLDGLPDECDSDIDGDGISNECDVDQDSSGLNPVAYFPFDSESDLDGWNVNGAGEFYPTVTDHLVLPGEPAHLQLDQQVVPVDGEFTISLWIKNDSSPVNSWRMAFNQIVPGERPIWIGAVRNTGNFRANPWLFDGEPESVSYPYLEPGRWYHVAATADWTSDTGSLYLDGELVQSGPFLDTDTQPLDFLVTYLGRQHCCGNEYWTGGIDQILIFGRQLSIAEVQALAVSRTSIGNDCNSNGVLDDCEIDSDDDGAIDECDPDDDNDGVPDECDTDITGGADCDANGVDDLCELGDDCNSNLIPDRCESDLDEDGVIDACDPDDDNDGIPDECDPRSTGGEDCDFNGVDDSCEPDLDQDGIIDACDDDDDGDGIPDNCDVDSASETSPFPGARYWSPSEGGNGHWYALIVDPGINFDQARQASIALGGDLAVVDSEPLNFWVLDNFYSEENWNGRHGPWIGLYQDRKAVDYEEPDGGWYWVDGTPAGYQPWAQSDVTCENMPAEYRCGAEGNEDYACDYGFYYCAAGDQCSPPPATWGAANIDISSNPSAIYSHSYLVEWSAASSSTVTQWRSGTGGNSHWYAAIESPAITWFDALEQAEQMGGHLATLTSALENQYMLQLVPQIQVEPGNGYWIGARSGSEGQFEWVTGEPFDYTSWGAGSCNDQPDGRDAIDLYCVNQDGFPAWSDDYFDWVNSRGFIVEWGASSPSPAVQWSVSDGGNGHWYQYVEGDRVCWNTANQLAQDIYKGHLASITSEAEGQFLIDLSGPISGDSGGQAWIGLFQDPAGEEPLGGWGWTTGEPLEFMNWGSCCSETDLPGSDYGTIVYDAGTSPPGVWNDYPNCFLGGRPQFFVEWSADCNNDGIVDYGQILDGTFPDEDQNGVPDCCDQGVPCSTPSGEDCNGNGVLDSCELEDNDCNTNGIPDDCEGFEDCNGNGTGDVCDIASGASQDINQDGVPDECQCIADIISDGVVDFQEVLAILNDWGPCGPPCPPDINADGEVSFIDLLRVLDAWGPCDP